MTHIRAALPRRGGNSFYRDRRDFSGYARTLCGAPVTDRDVDLRTAKTKKFRASGWPVCSTCQAVLLGDANGDGTTVAVEGVPS